MMPPVEGLPEGRAVVASGSMSPNVRNCAESRTSCPASTRGSGMRPQARNTTRTVVKMALALPVIVAPPLRCECYIRSYKPRCRWGFQPFFDAPHSLKDRGQRISEAVVLVKQGFTLECTDYPYLFICGRCRSSSMSSWAGPRNVAVRLQLVDTRSRGMFPTTT